ncbi:MAG: riboflavin synthase [Alphaproteobacteria bacterium]|nr:riboflavin synthase [Alphaproteobacteria bacterium]
MFTGLVSDVGRVTKVEDRNGLRRITMDSAYPVSALQMGASVTHGGVCLTLVEFGERAIPGKEPGSWWVVEAIPETLSRTVLGEWMAGSRVNLELSLRAGQELGGHIVSGHVDAMGEVVSVTPEGQSRRIRIGIPPDLAKFLALKGSICVDGVSLTVAGVGGDVRAEPEKAEQGLARYGRAMARETPHLVPHAPQPYQGPWFEVAVIPHTLQVTTLGGLTPGDRVNLEVDMLARYVARMLELRDE